MRPKQPSQRHETVCCVQGQLPKFYRNSAGPTCISIDMLSKFLSKFLWTNVNIMSNVHISANVPGDRFSLPRSCWNFPRRSCVEPLRVAIRFQIQTQSLCMHKHLNALKRPFFIRNTLSAINVAEPWHRDTSHVLNNFSPNTAQNYPLAEGSNLQKGRHNTDIQIPLILVSLVFVCGAPRKKALTVINWSTSPLSRKLNR